MGVAMDKKWLESFKKGEAIWPALPLPPAEMYEQDLLLRFDKLKVCKELGLRIYIFQVLILRIFTTVCLTMLTCSGI